MAGQLPGPIKTVAAGNRGWHSIIFANDDGSIFNLAGYAGWVTYWVDGAAPHVIRAGLILGSTGELSYHRQGDEYSTVGKLTWRQGTVCDPDGFETSSTPVARLVVRKPV